MISAKWAPVITLGRKREIHFGLEVIFQGGRTGVWGKVLNIANALEDQPREDKENTGTCKMRHNS